MDQHRVRGWIRLPVAPETCTVNGSCWKAESAVWTGLDLARAEPRVQSAIMHMVCGSAAPLDIHLSVPWCHPEDQTGSPDDFDCRYRVRPRMQPGGKWKGRRVYSVAIEKWQGEWLIAVEINQPHASPTA